jgi:hypothetical protein
MLPLGELKKESGNCENILIHLFMSDFEEKSAHHSPPKKQAVSLPSS